MKPIRTAPELYACAVCIEREAAERYREFAERMGDHGKDEVAEIFARLAVIEGEHLEALREKSRGMARRLNIRQGHWIDFPAAGGVAGAEILRSPG